MCPSVYLCVSLWVTIKLLYVKGHRFKIRDEKVPIWLLFAAISSLKFAFGNLLFFGLLVKALVAISDDLSVYFVVSKLLILAYVWATNQE